MTHWTSKRLDAPQAMKNIAFHSSELSERLAKCRSLRAMRSDWSALSEHDQWRLECHVYRLRTFGISEKEIANEVRRIVDRKHPWRMSEVRFLRELKLLEFKL